MVNKRGITLPVHISTLQNFITLTENFCFSCSHHGFHLTTNAELCILYDIQLQCVNLSRVTSDRDNKTSGCESLKYVHELCISWPCIGNTKTAHQFKVIIVLIIQRQHNIKKYTLCR